MKSLQILRKRKNQCTDFDRIIGHIEDILVDENFYNVQRSFLEMHWAVFEENEENKHEYMEIFTNYVSSYKMFISL